MAEIVSVADRGGERILTLEAVMSYEPEHYTDLEVVEKSGDIEGRVFAIFLEAAAPHIRHAAKAVGISHEAAVAAFMAFRTGTATENVSHAVNELTDGFRRQDDDRSERWRGDES